MENSNQNFMLKIQNCSVTNEDIIEAFPEFKIVNVNIKRTSTGTSRGFGYMQLESVVSKVFIIFKSDLKHLPSFVG